MRILSNEFRDSVNEHYDKDEYYVKTENPMHLVDIVNSKLELRHHIPTGTYIVVAIVGKITHVICRSSESITKGHCERVFKELKQKKQAILHQINRRQR